MLLRRLMVCDLHEHWQIIIMVNPFFSSFRSCDGVIDSTCPNEWISRCFHWSKALRMSSCVDRRRVGSSKRGRHVLDIDWEKEGEIVSRGRRISSLLSFGSCSHVNSFRSLSLVGRIFPLVRCWNGKNIFFFFSFLFFEIKFFSGKLLFFL